MRHLILIFAVAAATCLVGCSSELRPAPRVALPGPGAVAMGTAEGVRVQVRTNVAHPRAEFREAVTALYVIVDNGSSHDLVIRPQAFHLVTPSGRRLPALSAEDLRRSAVTPAQADIAIAMRALPEDVLAKGGRTEGFVYFYLDQLAADRATFTFELRAQTGARVGLIEIPLTRK